MLRWWPHTLGYSLKNRKFSGLSARYPCTTGKTPSCAHFYFPFCSQIKARLVTFLHEQFPIPFFFLYYFECSHQTRFINGSYWFCSGTPCSVSCPILYNQSCLTYKKVKLKWSILYPCLHNTEDKRKTVETIIVLMKNRS